LKVVNSIVHSSPFTFFDVAGVDVSQNAAGVYGGDNGGSLGVAIVLFQRLGNIPTP
jgi:hypothetical protein